MSDTAAPSKPILLGMYCWECGKVRDTEGRPPGRPEVSQCGFDYGEGLHSHLRVTALYGIPPDSGGGEIEP